MFKETRAIFIREPKYKLCFRAGIKAHNLESIAGLQESKICPWLPCGVKIVPQYMLGLSQRAYRLLWPYRNGSFNIFFTVSANFS